MRKRKINLVKTNKKWNLPWFVVVSVALFILASVFLTIETATTGARISLLEKEEQRLVSENRELSDRIMNASSLTNLSSIAGQFGFNNEGKIVYITPSDTFAKAQ